MLKRIFKLSNYESPEIFSTTLFNMEPIPEKTSFTLGLRGKRMKPISKAILFGCLISCVIYLYHRGARFSLPDQRSSHKFHYSSHYDNVHREKPTSLTLGDKDRFQVWRYKIMQLTDLDFGEAPDRDWGPAQDVKNLEVIDTLLAFEKPDFVVLTGDMLTADMIDNGAKQVYHKIGQALDRRGVKWGMTIGNHDDAAFIDRNVDPHVEAEAARVSREDLIALDATFNGSFSKAGPETTRGTSNYVIPIKDASDTARLILYMLDSGGGSIKEGYHHTHLSWFRDAAAEYPDIPGIAFSHIPPRKMKKLVESKNHKYRNQCFGNNLEPVTPVPENWAESKLYNELVAHGVKIMGFGHDHGNDMCCRDTDNDVELCFGRRSGYGGYGHFPRGARVYALEVDLDPVDGVHSPPKESLRWRSWVRFEDGTIGSRSWDSGKKVDEWQAEIRRDGTTKHDIWEAHAKHD